MGGAKTAHEKAKIVYLISSYPIEEELLSAVWSVLDHPRTLCCWQSLSVAYGDSKRTSLCPRRSISNSLKCRLHDLQFRGCLQWIVAAQSPAEIDEYGHGDHLLDLPYMWVELRASCHGKRTLRLLNAFCTVGHPQVD